VSWQDAPPLNLPFWQRQLCHIVPSMD
jgi:hypothetical protein